ncbi:hypothetical protein AVDCRST_MAG94-2722 [uncultured Leptolyngbya sp.]|uniref:Uncharacterized protein n=1 Tax=uncultured Leptolyngbya sp. TaxID=332963 RepID=A0A6J4M478_9CYAN|nr:hypothetical protein AVDCRST_MAG94-2722 [uncultured Leptolyngbya sp.]
MVPFLMMSSEPQLEQRSYGSILEHGQGGNASDLLGNKG